MSTSLAASTSPLDLVIFGGVGDLSVRKLLPALYMAHLHNNLPVHTRIHALGRQPWDRAAFVAFIQEKVPGFIGPKAMADASWPGFLERLHYVPLAPHHLSASLTQFVCVGYRLLVPAL